MTPIQVQKVESLEKIEYRYLQKILLLEGKDVPLEKIKEKVIV